MSALVRGDAWQPQLGSGLWRVWYGECCDALLAYDRVGATLPEGALRHQVAGLRDGMLPLLERARSLAELGAHLDPAGPVRDPDLLEALAADPIGDLSGGLGPPPTGLLRDTLLDLRDRLREVADDAARLALRTRENPATTDLAEWLEGLAAGIAAARKAGWIPVAYER